MTAEAMAIPLVMALVVLLLGHLGDAAGVIGDGAKGVHRQVVAGMREHADPRQRHRVHNKDKLVAGRRGLETADDQPDHYHAQRAKDAVLDLFGLDGQIDAHGQRDHRRDADDHRHDRRRYGDHVDGNRQDDVQDDDEDRPHGTLIADGQTAEDDRRRAGLGRAYQPVHRGRVALRESRRVLVEADRQQNAGCSSGEEAQVLDVEQGQ